MRPYPVLKRRAFLFRARGARPTVFHLVRRREEPSISGDGVPPDEAGSDPLEGAQRGAKAPHYPCTPEGPHYSTFAKRRTT